MTARKRIRIIVVGALLAATMVISVGAEARPASTFTVSASAVCGSDVAYDAMWDKARVSHVDVVIVDNATGQPLVSATEFAVKPARSGGVNGTIAMLLDVEGDYSVDATFLIRRGKRDVVVGTATSGVFDDCFDV